MYEHLPEWMNVRTVVSDSSHIWELSNGSVAYAFPTSAGDSYTATLAFVDEADLVPDLDTLMLSVKPTIDGGGRMILLSRSNKETPNSAFKKIYLAASQGLNDWHSLFLPWFSKPGRTEEWYEKQKEDFLTRTGTIDGLFEQYPASPEEALSPKSLNKRIPFEWLKRCYVPLKGKVHGVIPCTTEYFEPKQYRSYIIAADTAEGNPTSDDSSAHVLDAVSLEEQAKMVGKIEPELFGKYLVDLSEHYNNASIMVERNNHGHAVIMQIKNLGKEHLLMAGPDGKFGWPETAKTKAYIYDKGANLLRDGVPTIHSESTFIQLTSIEGNSLKAPEGSLDDQAVSFILSLVAGSVVPPSSFGFKYAISSPGSKHQSVRSVHLRSNLPRRVRQ